MKKILLSFLLLLLIPVAGLLSACGESNSVTITVSSGEGYEAKLTSFNSQEGNKYVLIKGSQISFCITLGEEYTGENMVVKIGDQIVTGVLEDSRNYSFSTDIEATNDVAITVSGVELTSYSISLPAQLVEGVSGLSISKILRKNSITPENYVEGTTKIHYNDSVCLHLTLEDGYNYFTEQNKTIGLNKDGQLYQMTYSIYSDELVDGAYEIYINDIQSDINLSYVDQDCNLISVLAKKYYTIYFDSQLSFQFKEFNSTTGEIGNSFEDLEHYSGGVSLIYGGSIDFVVVPFDSGSGLLYDSYVNLDNISVLVNGISGKVQQHTYRNGDNEQIYYTFENATGHATITAVGITYKNKAFINGLHQIYVSTSGSDYECYDLAKNAYFKTATNEYAYSVAEETCVLPVNIARETVSGSTDCKVIRINLFAWDYDNNKISESIYTEDISNNGEYLNISIDQIAISVNDTWMLKYTAYGDSTNSSAMFDTGIAKTNIPKICIHHETKREIAPAFNFAKLDKSDNVIDFDYNMTYDETTKELTISKGAEKYIFSDIIKIGEGNTVSYTILKGATILIRSKQKLTLENQALRYTTCELSEKTNFFTISAPSNGWNKDLQVPNEGYYEYYYQDASLYSESISVTMCFVEQ